MPTYEYACRTCGHHLEVSQSFSDEPLSTCPTCGGPLRKVFGSIGVVLKGSGFYKTDSRAASNGKAGAKKDAAAGASASSTPSGDGASTSSDTPSSSSPAGSSPAQSGKAEPSSKGGDSKKKAAASA
jgi:putative FmdB family regulatory protein